jgi:hypothetical protein
LTPLAVDLKTPPGIVLNGTLESGQKPDCTLTLSDEDMTDMVMGTNFDHDASSMGSF